MAKFLIITGIILIVAGLLVQFAPRVPFFGKMPGDIYIERGNFKFYFPIVSGIVLSIIISVILLLVAKVRR